MKISLLRFRLQSRRGDATVVGSVRMLGSKGGRLRSHTPERTAGHAGWTGTAYRKQSLVAGGLTEALYRVCLPPTSKLAKH
jgi:hypothetical protein